MPTHREISALLNAILTIHCTTQLKNATLLEHNYKSSSLSSGITVLKCDVMNIHFDLAA